MWPPRASIKSLVKNRKRDERLEEKIGIKKVVKNGQINEGMWVNIPMHKKTRL